jgi:hypothetical protein
LALVCTLAVASGLMAATFSSVLLPALLVLAFLGLAVWPMARAHAHACGYFIALVVLFGLVIEFTSAQRNAELLHQLRLFELVMLAAAALLAARFRRRPLPVVLLATPLLLAAVDVAAFVSVGFSRAVLTGGLNLYLHYFVLAIFVYYSSFDERDMRGLLMMMGAVFLAVAILAAIQFSTGRFFTPFLGSYYHVASRAGANRAVGLFAWPIELANFAGAWFFLFYCRAGRSGRALFYSIVCVALVVCIVLSVTRTAMLSLVALILLMEVKRLSPRLRLRIGVVAMALIAVVALASFRSIEQRASSTIHSSDRVYFLVQGIRVWEDNPIVGVGLGRYATDWSAQVDPAHPSVVAQYHIRKYAGVASTDSFVASLLPEFGLVGAGVLLASFLLLAQVGKRWGQADRITRGYLWCLFFVALCTINSNSVLYAPDTVVLWVSIGMLARKLHTNGQAEAALGDVAASTPGFDGRSPE